MKKLGLIICLSIFSHSVFAAGCFCFDPASNSCNSEQGGNQITHCPAGLFGIGVVDGATCFPNMNACKDATSNISVATPNDEEQVYEATCLRCINP